MSAFVTWLAAGTPYPHYVTFAFFAVLALEWYLPKTKSVAANSIVELVVNALRSLVPGLQKLLDAVGTPTPPGAP